MNSKNPWVNYYLEQVGSGISIYAGSRRQKGHGFFGKILRTAVVPVMRYLGEKALSTVADIGKDVIHGENIKTSAKKRAMDVRNQIEDDALSKARSVICQEGSGRRKRRKVQKKTNKKRKTKVKRSVSKKRLRRHNLKKLHNVLT